MENIQAKSGFLPGLFPRGKKGTKDMAGPKPIKFFQRLPQGPRNHFVAMVGEFMGTFLFLYISPMTHRSRSTDLIAALSQVLCLRRHPSGQYAADHRRLSEHRPSSRPRSFTTPVHQSLFWLFAGGQCVGLLQNIGWLVQSCCMCRTTLQGKSFIY